MSNNNTDTATSLTAQQAIDQALQAEQDSLSVIAQCEQEAERILSQARKVAHRISERADDRIAGIHQLCKLATDKAINELESADDKAGNHSQLASIDTQTLDTVVARLTEILTTPDQS